MTEARAIGPLIPWACTLWKNGKRYALTLYAKDYRQISRDFPEISVDGQLIGWIDK